MERSRSSTSSSDGRRRLLRDCLIAVALRAGAEAYLAVSLRAFDAQIAGHEPVGGEGVESPNIRVLGRQDAHAFLDHLSDVTGRRVVVFVGDSQGLGTHDGKGLPYPKEMAMSWEGGANGPVAVSLHLAGSNGYEQGLLLIALLDVGVVPEAVIWAHSVASERKNEIRSELVPLYRDLAPELARWQPYVVLVGAAEAAARTPAAGLAGRAGLRWESLVAKSATIRFARRPLYDKYQLLRRSPLGRMIPRSWLPGTAVRLDPPPTLLRASAAFVGQVSSELTARGVRVIHVLAPINRDVTPRPFTSQAEEALYPALREAAQGSGSLFLDLLDALPASHFGTYSDGSPDAYHVDGAGHALIAARLSEVLSAPGPGR